MMLPNYDEVEADVGSYETRTLPPGGYIARVLGVKTEIVSGRKKLKLAVDIDDGDYKNFFLNKFQRDQEKFGDAAKFDFNAAVQRYVFEDHYEGKRVSKNFKTLIEIIRSSNPEWQFDHKNFDEQSLVGKKLGCVFGEKKGRGKTSGKIFTASSIVYLRTVADIRSGNFKVPDPQILPSYYGTAADDTHATDDDLPF